MKKRSKTLYSRVCGRRRVLQQHQDFALSSGNRDNKQEQAVSVISRACEQILSFAEGVTVREKDLATRRASIRSEKQRINRKQKEYYSNNERCVFVNLQQNSVDLCACNQRKCRSRSSPQARRGGGSLPICESSWFLIEACKASSCRSIERKFAIVAFYIFHFAARKITSRKPPGRTEPQLENRFPFH